ncbi:MAG: diaminopimelate decarboxylase, partial [Gaiellales bacterium]
ATVEVLRVLFDEGLGADVASEGELACALAAGASSPGIIVHGNNKSDSDIAAAIGARAGLVVLDHAGEASQVERLAAAAGRPQRVLVRVTPDIVADTHHKIVTAHAGSKFGLAPADALDVLDEVERLPHLEAAGLHVHLGSQIRDLSTYMDAIEWMVEFIEQHGLGRLPTLDLGGGLAIPYTEAEPRLDPQEAVERIVFHLAQRLVAHGLPVPELILEPGRSVVGPAGVTLYTVGAVKPTAAGITYAAVDGGMSDNPRPTLYGAVYDVLLADRADVDADHTYTIAGKHCESGDLLVEDARLPELRGGEVLAVPATGAYAASMASNYNALPRPAAVMVNRGAARLIVRRETIDDLLSRDVR